MTRRIDAKPSRLAQSTAARLLAKVLATGWYTKSAIAVALGTTDETLSTYVDGDVPIPLNRQLRLALFVIEYIPPLRRAGHKLRGQIAASIAYRAQETEIHSTPPPANVWPG